MGILTSSEQPKTPITKKRGSGIDFSNLKPLKSSSTAKNFAGYRDAEASKNSVLNRLAKRTKDEDDMDSDVEEDGEELPLKKPELEEEEDPKDNNFLSPEDVNRSDRLAEGVKKINLVFESTILCTVAG
jgi:hypothetical protein